MKWLIAEKSYDNDGQFLSKFVDGFWAIRSDNKIKKNSGELKIKYNQQLLYGFF